MSETMDLFWLALQDCIAALPITIFLTVVSVLIGLCLAIPLAVISQREKTLGARLTNGFVYFFTGTPLLVQLYIFYFGIERLHAVSNSMHTPGWELLKEGYIWLFAS